MLQYSQMPKNDSLVSWMWFFIAPHKWMFFLFTSIRTLGNACFILAPLFIKELVDFINSSDFQETPSKAYMYVAAIGLVHLFAYILFYFRNYEGMLRDIIKREMTLFAMKHMVNLPLEWHESEGTGNKMQRIFTARNSLSDLILMFFAQGTLFYAKTITLLLIISFTTPPIFLLLFSVYVGVYFSTSYFSSKKLVYLNDVCQEFFENILGKVYEFASSVFTVKFLNLLPFVEKKAWDSEMRQRKNIDQLLRAIYKRWTILNNIGNICFTGIALYAIYALIQGDISQGTTIMVIWFAWDLWGILDSFAEIQENFFEKKNGFLRLTETLRAEPKQLDFHPLKKFPSNWKNIELEAVSFSYDHKETLKNITLSIPRNQKIALVGKSGSGKSTFIKLLMKQILPQKGTICFDDINLQNIAHKDILKHMSIVLQDTELFNVSIEENIILDSKNSKRLKKYLKMAHATGFVSQLSEKEHTVIGERGVKLSGGEKQRIGIARALARESDIIIFDEATSALDSESEQEIQKAMHEMFQNKTAIIIAHRLSTIKEVDRILVFDKGKIIEDGTFEKLLKQEGTFAKLWKLQKLD